MKDPSLPWNDEARHGGRDQAAAVQHDPHFAVTQHHVEVVIAQGAGALGSQISLDPVRLTEQLQRLIEDVGTEIRTHSPEPGPPASRQRLTHLGAIAIEVRFKLAILPSAPSASRRRTAEEVRRPSAGCGRC